MAKRQNSDDFQNNYAIQQIKNNGYSSYGKMLKNAYGKVTAVTAGYGKNQKMP